MFYNTVFLSSDISLEEAEILNLEVTPEIEELLKHQAMLMRDEEKERALAYEAGVDTHVPKWSRASLETDLVAQMLELQVRKEYGMEGFILPATELKDRAYDKYATAKAAFQVAKDYLEEYKKINNVKDFPYWDRFNELKDIRTRAWESFDMERTELSQYWAHWHVLNDECADLGRQNSSVWHTFFERFMVPVRNNHRSVVTYINKLGEEVVKQQLDHQEIGYFFEDFKEDNTWFTVDDNATFESVDIMDEYSEGHIAALIEEEQWQPGEWKSARPASYCKDVTRLYIRDEQEDLESLLSSIDDQVSMFTAPAKEEKEEETVVQLSV